MLKVISMYLPQFHEIKENNEWWGEGYTEWTAVKGAKQYFDGHYQPHVPLNKNYYNLLDKKTMSWQAELMKKYNVYGQSFYHYYFEDGRKILEKPAENLLQWKDIDMPFCFTWANESWIRTWSAINGVCWNSNIEERPKGDGILLKQNYGEKKEWIDHFNYLLDFFKDERYIKIDNKPLFIVYKPLDIYCIDEMSLVWEKLAVENGFSGIYFVGVNASFKAASAILLLESNNVGLYLDKITQYEQVCEQIVTSAAIAEEKVLFCGTPGYDDSPRRGKRGSIFKDSTPELFYEQMKNLSYISKLKNNEFLFVNAWNEWGEGMYLEPDEIYEYQYLDALKRGVIDGNNLDNEGIEKCKRIVEKGKSIRIKKQDDRIKQLKFYEGIYEKLLKGYEKNHTFATILMDLNVKSAAIYGLGNIGRHIIAELKGTEIEIAYGIDKDATEINTGFFVYTIDDVLPEVDIVIVTTPKADFEKLKKKKCKYMTIEELMNVV
ncbi:glycoside hydrolase family 99-like domain-containing protein [Pseudobutyrivibrio xylanivorans]|uniref:D-isomer specific 2-hydroxyacid dehydrogenase NAD-binding domain-containing protein n=1 Tax=Pseudobutyrivibrio xylanivorans TaxID=185007 RepID=A0A5P6VR70_PSEXY|nr:glycoside hydrolase family 99-like domain-containing protein [Pseudobutyrivibrio xylanivorans]QFJ54990.1 hypothetical protein FXF36_09010 [Pseudobutyrivibrio xylanivorans]